MRFDYVMLVEELERRIELASFDEGAADGGCCGGSCCLVTDCPPPSPIPDPPWPPTE